MLKRSRAVMQVSIRRELDAAGLLAFKHRSPYQRNDDLSWIARSVRPATRRIDRMLGRRRSRHADDVPAEQASQLIAAIAAWVWATGPAV